MGAHGASWSGAGLGGTAGRTAGAAARPAPERAYRDVAAGAPAGVREAEAVPRQAPLRQLAPQRQARAQPRRVQAAQRAAARVAPLPREPGPGPVPGLAPREPAQLEAPLLPQVGAWAGAS